MAAVLPCFWIYWDVGNAIAREAATENRYRAWIDTYSDEGFGNAVRAVMAATDTAAEGASAALRDRMMTAFIRSTQYEYLFWEGAYQLRRWPVVFAVTALVQAAAKRQAASSPVYLASIGGWNIPGHDGERRVHGIFIQAMPVNIIRTVIIVHYELQLAREPAIPLCTHLRNPLLISVGLIGQELS